MSQEKITGQNFQYQKKRDIETFKLIESSERKEAFKYLDNKNLEAFKLIDAYKN